MNAKIEPRANQERMNKIIKILMSAALFVGGFLMHNFIHVCPDAEPKVVTEYVDKVKTEIVYVPKAADENTDIDIKIGKPELNVKVNDKEFAIQKADDEKYIFDKNKLTLTQTSQSELHISIPTVDKTKRWQIGIGASKDGAVGFVGFPINRNEYIGGWIAGNEDYQMGGLSIKF